MKICIQICNTCDLFWHYLFTEHNIVLQQISCAFKKDGSRHNWLETLDGLIIDLTADQFKGRSVMYAEPDDGYYSRMKDRRFVDVYCILNDERLLRDYEVIMEYI